MVFYQEAFVNDHWNAHKQCHKNKVDTHQTPVSTEESRQEFSCGPQS